MKKPDVLLVHSSDLHVDDDRSPGFYHGLVGLRAVIGVAHKLGADAMLLAGDTFDNARIPGRILDQAAAILASAPMPVVMLPGNHDPLMPECLYRRAGIVGLPQVHVLGLTHPDAILFDELGLEVCGIAHRGLQDQAPLGPARPRRRRFQVVMAHGHYVPPAEWSDQAHRAWKFSDDAVAQSGADYIALGHWDRATPVGDGRVPA
jgi:DNA repair exonuclease SbcCD nuclease subunit